jgi:hypothetical protein
MLAHPVGQVPSGAKPPAVEPAGVAIVDIFQRSSLTQPCGAQPGPQAAVVALEQRAVNPESKMLLEAEAPASLESCFAHRAP